MHKLNFLDQLPTQKGFQTIFSYDPKTMKISNFVHSRNQIMDDAAEIQANLLIGNGHYKIQFMYYEYQNLASAGDAVTPPTFDKSDDVEYFTGLEFSSDRDFLRVPVKIDNKITTLGSGAKLVTFFATTPGDEQGFFGKPFNSANNSAVYGGALVSAPLPSSQPNDLIFARNYPLGAKILKPEGEQIAMTWNIEIALPEAGS